MSRCTTVDDHTVPLGPKSAAASLPVQTGHDGASVDRATPHSTQRHPRSRLLFLPGANCGRGSGRSGGIRCVIAVDTAQTITEPLFGNKRHDCVQVLWACRFGVHLQAPANEGKLCLWAGKVWPVAVYGHRRSRQALGHRWAEGVIQSYLDSRARSRVFVTRAERLDKPGSMGRVRACGDNAAWASHFSLLQKHALNRRL